MESFGHIVYREDGGVWDERLAWDFVAEEGTPVGAAADGVVVEVVRGVAGRWREASPPPAVVMSLDETNGNYVVVEHDHGERSVYCHLRDGGIVVEPGARVRRGERLGEVGCTGWCTEPHLHFAVCRPWLDGTRGYLTLEVDWEESPTPGAVEPA